MSTEAQSTRPQVRPWIRKLAIYVLPVLAVFCALAVWNYVETRRLHREIDAIVARGEPITRFGRPVNHSEELGKGENAEYIYAAAAMLSLARDVGHESRAARHPLMISSKFVRVRDWVNGRAQKPASAELDAAKQMLEGKWQDALALVDKAAARPHSGFDTESEFSGRISGLYNLARLVSSRTIGLSLEGEGNRAVDSAISAIRLRRAIRPSQRWLDWVAHEVPVILSLSKPSEEALARLQATLAREEDPDGSVRDFIEMRGRLLDDAWGRFYRVPAGRLPPPFPTELLPSPQMRPFITHELVRSLRAWAELLEIARKPWPERLRLAGDAVARYKSERFKPGGLNGVLAAASIFRQTLVPDILIYDRTSQIAVALERYRRTHADALPPTLDALVPQYLNSIPEDPLIGQPLRFRPVPDGYVVYSVGPDGQDDGGVQLRRTPMGTTGEFPPGADMGIRVLIRHP